MRPRRFKFYRFDISVQLLDGPSVLNYLVGLVGGQAPLASHTVHLAARWAGLWCIWGAASGLGRRSVMGQC